MTVQELKNLCREMNPDQHEKVIDMLWLAIEGKTKEHSNLFKEIKETMSSLDKKVALLDQKVDFVQVQLKDDALLKKNKEKFWYEAGGKIILNLVILSIVYIAGSMGIGEAVKALTK